MKSEEELGKKGQFSHQWQQSRTRNSM